MMCGIARLNSPLFYWMLKKHPSPQTIALVLLSKWCVCVQAFGSRGGGVITQFQSLPLAPRKVLPICVTQ